MPGRRKKQTVLVAEDDPIVARAIQACLDRTGYNIIQASDGREALNMIGEHRPDLVVLDVMMPEMHGWDVLERMRQDTSFDRTPVIILSALGQDYNIEESERRGANRHLTKPFDPDQLRDAVTELLAEYY